MDEELQQWEEEQKRKAQDEQHSIPSVERGQDPPKCSVGKDGSQPQGKDGSQPQGNDPALWSVAGSPRVEPDDDDPEEPGVAGSGGLVLGDAAYLGPLGRMVDDMAPLIEPAPVAVLLNVLAIFGNSCGRNGDVSKGGSQGAWFRVGKEKHYPALFLGVVGKPSDSKGTAFSKALDPFLLLAEKGESAKEYKEYIENCILYGVKTGEGLIDHIHDEQVITTKSGIQRVVPGAKDKRCFIRLDELSAGWHAARGRPLSEYMRTLWDGKPVPLRTRGCIMRASNYTTSLSGDTTPALLDWFLKTGLEGSDGTASRYIWVLVRRQRLDWTGGDVSEACAPYLQELSEALTFGKTAGELPWDRTAAALYEKVYGSLRTACDTVPHTERAAPYVCRLALIYALSMCSKVIGRAHLEAALAVWDYWRVSCRLLFSPKAVAARDPLWKEVLQAIKGQPGINKKQLHGAFNNRLTKEELNGALEYLERNSLAQKTVVQGGGRPAECWYPCGV
jgi:hypothetical protein